MKFVGAFAFVGLLATFCTPHASAKSIDIDFTRVISIEETERYWRRLPAEMQYLRSVEEPPRRITNGQLAATAQFPYQAVVYSDAGDGYYSLCGGSILTKNYILTAAHCVTDDLDQTAPGGIVILGATDRTVVQSTQQRMTFSKAGIRVHPQYNSVSIRNDIATVRLDTPAVFNAYVNVIDLPALSDARQFGGVEGTASGFGRTTDTSAPSSVLMFVRNPVMTNAQCNLYWSTSSVEAQNVCLDPTGGRSACNGDSGGPLTVQDAGRSLQVGIASFVSARGCTSGAPSVWVRVSYFRDWIRQNSDYVFRA
ncbi:brachyurin-like [Anopheles maculipalpis]|uniref:brachyurin-like n=1 Tax=Anopheles maculipalpis TaxID=1496333 RepID=UPI0021597210|nr:brachyurin-like [Anopheles maculipalpis]